MDAKHEAYKLVTDNHPEKLGAAVTELLRDGWSLYGDPVIAAPVVDDAVTPLYAQAVVKPRAGHVGTF